MKLAHPRVLFAQLTVREILEWKAFENVEGREEDAGPAPSSASPPAPTRARRRPTPLEIDAVLNGAARSRGG